MTPNSFVQFVQAKMGVSPGWGGAGRLVRMVGRRKALQLLGGSLKMDAQLAQQLEYADGVVTADGLEEQLKAFFEPYLSQKHPGNVCREIFSQPRHNVLTCWSHLYFQEPCTPSSGRSTRQTSCHPSRPARQKWQRSPRAGAERTTRKR